MPGNAGIAELAECRSMPWEDHFDQLADFAESTRIDLTVVGPEAPLANGIVDAFAGTRTSRFRAKPERGDT